MQRNKYAKIRPKSIVRKEAWLLLILGLLLGNAFFLGARQWSTPVTWENAIHDTAQYTSSRASTGRKRQHRQIFVYCEEREPLVVDSACVSWALVHAFDDLESGTELTLVIHPDGETIMELWAEGARLLEFYKTADQLRQERNAFAVMGLICYGIALVSAVRLVKMERIRRKKKRSAS